MKTIATAAALMMLAAPTWADELKSNDPANTKEPIVLSDADLDEVTAGLTMLGPVVFTTITAAEHEYDFPCPKGTKRLGC